ncbi:hypothetical protein BT96DRAFT_945069 [Gymnopus androsaceus JB14]|uniref:Uncharacterized protein n=1 Tax=Gymnopus androsaceus JB14 TaxID=1447944 RepID=A0A6A4H2D1_9AGAR|nr:hypothetical protein BT96DRAFT_945069 [Gymnopus androsaceus JB14]
MKANQKATTKPKAEAISIDSSSESDGQWAQCKDKKKGFWWEFKCRFCPCVERTVTGPHASFDDKPKLPKMNNLATHANECKGKPKCSQAASNDKDEESTTAECLNLKDSAKLMKNYLKDRELNPEAITTAKGFPRLFAAWILDEDLPWTTGEALSCGLLFKYLKIRYALPSDTSVHNQLAKVFTEMHAKVVRTFSSVMSKIAYAKDTSSAKMVWAWDSL